HMLALKSNGNVVGWGEDAYGELTPLASVTRSIGIAAGGFDSLVLVPMAPFVAQNPVGSLTLSDSDATLTGTVNPRGQTTTAQFDYGLTPSYDSTMEVILSPASGIEPQPVSATLTGLSPSTLYYYRLTATNTVGSTTTSAGTFTTRGAPQISVQSPTGTTLTSGTGSTSLGTVSVSSSGAPATFTVTNTGAGTLQNLLITKDGAHPGDFTVSALGATVLGASQSTTFTVTFSPTASGTRTAALHIASNAPTPNPFHIAVTGTGQATAGLGAWRQTWFGTTSNSGNAADNADPDNDGILNLFEWGCELSPTSASVLPLSIVRNGANLEVTYTRSIAAVAAGAQFQIEWNDSVGATGWQTTGVGAESILSSNALTQQVRVVLPSGGLGRRFVHLLLTSP
ncbi:MAG: choice-of-anchor D domain-containing protein, partial [Roseimicrobium sp.]